MNTTPLPTDVAPGIKSQRLTLLTMVGDELCYATSVSQKRSLPKDGPLWVVWMGQYSANAHTVTRSWVEAGL